MLEPLARPQRSRDAILSVAAALAASLFLLFLVAPLVGLVGSGGSRGLRALASDPELRASLMLTVGTATLATALGILGATPVAYALARGRFRGRALVSAFNDDLEAHTRTLVRREGGPLAVVDLIDAEAQPVRQRPGRRPFHAPLQVVELVAVAGPLVGGHDAPLLLLVLRPDAVSRIVAQVRAVDRFAVLALAGALIAPHVPWHVQPDRASEAALAALIVLVVVVADHDLVAEGARGLRARVGDQGLTLGEFQLEVLAQGASDLPFALFSFVPWSADAEQPTIGIAHVPQAPVAWITGVLRATGHLLPLPTPLAGLVALPWCAQVTDPVLQT